MIDEENLDPFTITNKIAMQVAESQDAFIFQTISDFASSNYQIIIEKEELVRAIQLIRMSRQYGPSIDKRWETATQQCAALDDAYKRGFQDGRDEEHARIMEILNKKGEK